MTSAVGTLLLRITDRPELESRGTGQLRDQGKVRW
jgi:hypothetical protein